jgi:two-component system response regulator NreC
MSAARIRVLLADDHRVVREGLAALLRREADFEVSGEADDGAAAVRLAEERSPDIVVMDLSMRGVDGVEAMARLRRSRPEIQVVVLSMHDDAPTVDRALRAGARAYVLKGSESASLCTAIRAVARGEVYLSPEISDFVLQGYLKPEGDDPLSEREREVLKLIAEGNTNQEIADILHLSRKTVESHRANIMRKLDLHDVTELVKYALRTGLIKLD